MELNINSKYLFLGCHLDDVEYGCGGLLAKLIQSKMEDKIRIHILSCQNFNSRGEVQLSRNLEEKTRSVRSFGLDDDQYLVSDIKGQRFCDETQKIRELLIMNMSEFIPDMVFFPSKNDVHQDHKTLNEEAFRIFRNKSCFGYEIVRSCYHFQPNLYIELSPDNLRNKIVAVMSYESQKMEGAGYYFNEDAITTISKFRGFQSGVLFAEAYEIYSLHIKHEDSKQ
jgi:LmbE family N-acetylglucosaminyl deacetylase